MLVLDTTCSQEYVKWWFYNYKKGKFREYANIFEEDDGSDLLGYTEDQLQKFLNVNSKCK